MRIGLTVLLVLSSALPARAELVYFTSGRTMSVKAAEVSGDRAVLTFRTGGEMVCEAAIIDHIAPDEIPYPEPEVVATANQAGPPASRQAVAADPRYDRIIQTAAAKHGVDPDLVRAVIQVESNYQSRARSAKGAVGLMQVLPTTARQYGVRNLYDPTSNIEVGIRHLKTLLERYPLKLALAAYNAGQAAVDRFNGIPPYRETEDYVSRILALVGA